MFFYDFVFYKKIIHTEIIHGRTFNYLPIFKLDAVIKRYHK